MKIHFCPYCEGHTTDFRDYAMHVASHLGAYPERERDESHLDGTNLHQQLPQGAE